MTAESDAAHDKTLDACLAAMLTRDVEDAKRTLAEMAVARPEAVRARLPAIANEAAGPDVALRLRAAEVLDVASKAGIDIGAYATRLLHVLPDAAARDALVRAVEASAHIATQVMTLIDAGPVWEAARWREVAPWRRTSSGHPLRSTVRVLARRGVS